MGLRAAFVMVGVALSACGGTTADGKRTYADNDLVLVTAYTAKESCSCLFVIGQTEEYCRAWTVQSPEVTSWSVDYGTQTVTATALTFWGARAHYVSREYGCVLE